MRRFFVKNLIFVIAVNLLVKPVWVIFIDRTVQNRVGNVFGTYSALFNFSLIFSILLDFGINNYNSRTISQNPGQLKTLFPSMLSARLALMISYIVLVALIGLAIGYRGWEIMLLLGILVIQSLNTLLQFLRSNVAALHKFKADGVLSVTDRFLMILICGFLLLYPATAKNFKIEWYVATQIICYAVACIVAFLVLKKIHPVKLRFSLHWPTLKKIIKESFSYALLIFLMSIYTRADTTLIERMCGAEGNKQAFIYASATRWLDVSNMFGLMFASMLLPLFGRMLAEHKDVQPIVRLCVNILLPLSFIVAVAALYFGYPIIHMFTHTATPYSGHVFGWVMACFPAFCLMYIYSTLLTSNGDLAVLNKIALAGVIINISLNLYLIPHFQSLGAAITAFITQSILAVCFIIFCKKKIQLPTDFKWAGTLIGFLVAVVVIGYLVTLLHTQWLLQLGIFGIISLVIMFSFGFISVKSIRELSEKKAL